MEDIVLYRNNEEILRCSTKSYVETFLEETTPENIWVEVESDFVSIEDFMNA